jgi:hypothetical protein
VADRVLDQVEENAVEILGVRLGRGQVVLALQSWLANARARLGSGGCETLTRGLRAENKPSEVNDHDGPATVTVRSPNQLTSIPPAACESAERYEPDQQHDQTDPEAPDDHQDDAEDDEDPT